MEPDLITVTDAADKLGVTRSVITYLCQRGNLRSFTPD
jgi:hypothetical protein